MCAGDSDLARNILGETHLTSPDVSIFHSIISTLYTYRSESRYS